VPEAAQIREIKIIVLTHWYINTYNALPNDSLAFGTAVAFPNFAS
jgi:hypothetical protein